MPDVIDGFVKEDEFRDVLLNEAEVLVAAEVGDVVRAAGDEVVEAMTLWPLARRKSVRCEPKKPAAPVMTEVGLVGFFVLVLRAILLRLWIPE